MYKNTFKPVIKNYLVLLLLTVLFRISFYVYNQSLFPISLSEFFYSFIFGLRFDLAAVSMVFSLYLIALLMPFKKLYLGFYLLSSSVLTYLYLIDIEYYQFVGKRLRLDVFGEGGDFFGQMVQITIYYWPMAVIFFVVLYLCFKAYSPFNNKDSKKYYQLPILIILNFILIRGGLQLKSISPQTAFMGGSFARGVLTLNPVYTFFRTLNDKGTTKIEFFPTDQEAVTLIKSQKTQSGSSSYPKQNIVVIILESFSMEYLEYAPFLKELQNKSVYFENGIAGGRRSMEAMPSIFQSFPSLISEPIYKSTYQTNKSETLGKTLKEEGYQTVFFHGGKLGTMGFDAYALSAGFNRYYSMNDYPDQEHYDGTWGIYDHYYLNFFNKELSQLPEPFLASIFTLSSHHPYKIPTEFKGQFPEGELPIHKTIGYADYGLKQFFNEASKEKWFENTLFVITADHSQKRITKKYQNVVGEYRVPIYFYHPKINLEVPNRNKVVSHVDIFPSVLDFLGIKPEKQNLFGTSIFAPDQGSALFHSGDIYFYLQGNQLSFMSIEGEAQSKKYNFDTGELNDTENNNEQISLLKAYIQYTNNGLRKDNLYLPNP